MRRNRHDNHHIIFNRQEWSLRQDARLIREHPSLIVNMERSLHEEIHASCPAVPLLGHAALQIVRANWTPDYNTLTSMDNLLFAIDSVAAHPRSHSIERAQALLTSQAVELQRPYIIIGVVENV